jgi:hypothetical protein
MQYRTACNLAARANTRGAYGTYLSAFYRQIMRGQGKHKAVMAVTHKILVIAWTC